VVWFLWLWVRMLETVDAHSGYQFPFSPFHLLDSIQGNYQLFPLPIPLQLCALLHLITSRWCFEVLSLLSLSCDAFFSQCREYVRTFRTRYFDLLISDTISTIVTTSVTLARSSSSGTG
jgi:hypothetical protein